MLLGEARHQPIEMAHVSVRGCRASEGNSRCPVKCAGEIPRGHVEFYVGTNK